ncbi:MAG TPA: LUD domain-containing protein [Anaerolineales bacterium]|nr:LUD domain-containing protein [Anaerolineales bacterium]
MSTTAFRERIRTSLANETLQIALDANAERRVMGRVTAFASLPDWRERRQQAHAVRAEVIEHLEEYLEQFISRAEENGIIVHRAQDAAEAIRIVLEITKNSPQRHGEHREVQKEIRVNPRSSVANILVAKSKSMVSEEINLNHALEAEGIRIIETDLGEYIVQLRHERPSHIITPAVHLRRNDVGQLFHEKLGIPYTEDIPTLTNTARRVLRDVFLTADVGISGINFGVAETGTLCIVTNEGNGRMVTTLPPVHIALMGMERLVRNLDDLALMLSLLPRSATGQKLSVYTQLIHSPSPPSSTPRMNQQRHLIILDNGRTRLRNSPLKESLYCIRCGACLNACPVFRELGGHAYNSVYPGPIGSVISAGFFGSDFIPLAQASSLCGACKDACPVDIDLPKLLTRVRAGQTPRTSDQLLVTSGGLSMLSKFFLQMYSRLARSPRLFAISQRLASLGTHLVSPFSNWIRPPALTGWGYSKDLPRFAAKPFHARFKHTPALPLRYAPGTVVAGGARGDAESTEKSERKETIDPNRAEPIPDLPIPNSKIEQFTDELTKVSGNIIHTNENDLTNKVIEFLKARDIQHIHLEPEVLDESILQKAGITISHAPDPALRAGVTKAICGLADTGSVVIVDGEGYPLQASLLPEIHIAVLHASHILPSLADAMTLPIVRESRSAVVITGPSRTGDIEMSHTIGVHGPGEVHVFLVHRTASTLVDD